MKYYSILFCFLLIGSQAFAQNDPAAKKILDQMKSDFDSHQSTEIDFALIIEIPEQAAETQNGSIIQSGDKYQINLDQQSIYCDGTSVWIHLKDNNEVQITDYDGDDSGEILSPRDIMKVYESGEYEYVLMGEFKEGGKPVKQIEFIPKDKDSEYFKMRMTIHTKSNQLKRVKVFAKDGSRFTMEVNNISFDKKYEASTFTFDASKFPGVHMEDLRF